MLASGTGCSFYSSPLAYQGLWGITAIPTAPGGEAVSPETWRRNKADHPVGATIIYPELYIYCVMIILKTIYTIYAWLMWILMGFWAFLWALIITITMGEKGTSRIVGGYRNFAKAWFFAIGMRMKVKGKEIRNKSEACIVVSNHCSNIDMMVTPYSLPTPINALAKVEIKKIPMLGFMFKAVSVFVDRKDAESRKKAVEEMKGKISRGIYMFIYPEGTRNRTKKPLKEFYDGAFRMAIEIQKPILPVVYLNLRKIAPLGRFAMQPGKIIAEYLEPISTVGMTETDIPNLKKKVFDIMYNHILTNDPYFKSNK